VIPQVPSVALMMLFSIPSLCSGKSIFLATIQVLAFKHKYSRFSLFTVAMFCKAACTELENTGLLPLKEIQGEVPVSLKPQRFHQPINI